MAGCTVKLGDGPFEPLILLAIAGSVPKNVSLMDDCMANEDKWPVDRRDENDDNVLLWHHSDWKNLAYPFVYRLFDKIKENNGGG